MAVKIDRDALIDRLEPIWYDGSQDDEHDQLEQMSLGAVLLALTEINHEREHELCRRVAEHLLGRIEEPEDIFVE